jgi:hypothetical protein
MGRPLTASSTSSPFAWLIRPTIQALGRLRVPPAWLSSPGDDGRPSSADSVAYLTITVSVTGQTPRP